MELRDFVGRGIQTGEVAKITEDIKTESYQGAPEIETDREKIKKRIKRGIPITGMTKQEVIQTLGEPKER